MTAKPERDLVVVVPVYNEQACIRKVLAEWSFEIENWTTNFEIIVINDGSSDGSREQVEALVPKHQGKLTLVSRETAATAEVALKAICGLLREGPSGFCKSIPMDNVTRVTFSNFGINATNTM